MSIEFHIVDQAGLAEEGGHEDYEAVIGTQHAVDLLQRFLVHDFHVLYLTAVRQDGLDDKIAEDGNALFTLVKDC